MDRRACCIRAIFSLNRLCGRLTNWILVLVALVVVQSAFATGRDRIVDSGDMPKSPVRGNIHPLAKAGLDQGSVSGSTVMHHITIFFNRTLEQQNDLDRLLKEQQDPSSGNYHKWLPAPEYALRFGLSEGDFQKVTT